MTDTLRARIEGLADWHDERATYEQYWFKGQPGIEKHRATAKALRTTLLLINVVNEIAEQPLDDEIPEEEEGDFQEGYNICVRTCRVAQSALKKGLVRVTKKRDKLQAYIDAAKGGQ